jgi:hypothetical protein
MSFFSKLIEKLKKSLQITIADDYGRQLKKEIDNSLTGQILNRRSGNLFNSIEVRETIEIRDDETIYDWEVLTNVDYGAYWVFGIKRDWGIDQRDWLGWSVEQVGGEKEFYGKIEENWRWIINSHKEEIEV